VTFLLGSGVTSFVSDALDKQVQIDAIGLGAIYALMAVGIGLVFGVLRLVNFAYGQLIMAGAYALAFASVVGVLGALGLTLTVSSSGSA
jgi:branched-chain amino acid transport system permease protein